MKNEMFIHLNRLVIMMGGNGRGMEGWMKRWRTAKSVVELAPEHLFTIDRIWDGFRLADWAFDQGLINSTEHNATTDLLTCEV